jgi:hypothetical protein
MIDWRTILKAPPTAPQNTQNEQNATSGGDFAHIADIAHSISEQEIAPRMPAVGRSAPPLMDEPPASPLPHHCFVTYIDARGALCGGWDERGTSRVTQCHGTGGNCQVELSDGRRIPLRSIRAVGQTDAAGNLLAAWTVREHGYDGNR